MPYVYRDRTDRVVCLVLSAVTVAVLVALVVGGVVVG